MRPHVARMAVCMLIYLGAVRDAEAGLLDVLFSSRTSPAPQIAQTRELRPIAPGAHLFRQPVRPAHVVRRHPRVSHVRRAPAASHSATSTDTERATPQDLHSILDQQGAEAAFLQDPTLQPGDVVVLAHGLRVFEGRPGAHHSESDFVSVEHAGTAHRAELIAMERANMIRTKGLRNVVLVATKHRPSVLTIRREIISPEALSENGAGEISLRKSD